MPKTFQVRLTIGFLAVVALTVALVSVPIVQQLDAYFYAQEQQDLRVRAETVKDFVVATANVASGQRPVVGPDNGLDPIVRAQLAVPATTRFLADRLAQASIQVRLGSMTQGPGKNRTFVPSPNAVFSAPLTAQPEPGQARERITISEVYEVREDALFSYAVEVRLSDPYTFKASTLRDVSRLLAAIAALALVLALILALFMARRFTTPLRRLTEASRNIAEGDLESRVPAALTRQGGREITELADQFNAMAERLEESVDQIRQDRDRSRAFLADVSHELRTPLAALRTFNELLKEHAADDPVARDEFLEASGQQIERLDWLAQNLLELSKLDSGLVLLDLRPDDLRAAVESAVEQAEAGARRRGVALSLQLPDSPVRTWHDPQRIGQVVSNLVGNALKFTPRHGSVAVTLRPVGDGAAIEVRDTGVGIDANEMPHIFDRFFRGSRANEARGSGSGLGLAIVKSVVDMHNGRISVESRVGRGTRFVVSLPADPRLAVVPAEPPAPEPEAAGAAAGAAAGGAVRVDARSRRSLDPENPVRTRVTNSSPTERPAVNGDVPEWRESTPSAAESQSRPERGVTQTR